MGGQQFPILWWQRQVQQRGGPPGCYGGLQIQQQPGQLHQLLKYSDALDDIFDNEDNSTFPPEISDYQDANMTKEPFITVDKARFDIFNQY